MVQGRSLGWQMWLGGFLILAVLGLCVALAIFIVKANSKACKDGLLAEEECHGVTRLLEVRLTQAWESLLRTEVQAATCNETVVTLLASLEMEKAQSQEWLAKGEELRGEKAESFPRRRIRRDGSREIEELKHKLQNASVEVERLRKGTETSSKKKEVASASSLKALSPLVVSVHLLLAFVALLA
ncbi:bone marrow stromal antigen 2 isoform X1 [Leopardus geoffroyi]|uniref:bone marrow stromal antigen 2 isoform X1 n=1 Tax=Leopardus geoffroyi TaxID=46844 RepID=UPI001E261ABE|nr:bone marrow stromal antigen 2 isoform X1 [Leopardus geoffroyi]